MSSLGDILSELREDRGLTQRDLSKMLNLSNSSISAYETGARSPTAETLVSLAKFFDVTTDYLLGITSNNISPSILSEELVDGKTAGAVIQSLKILSPTQRAAILLILENMRFCAEVRKKSEQNGECAP